MWNGKGGLDMENDKRLEDAEQGMRDAGEKWEIARAVYKWAMRKREMCLRAVMLADLDMKPAGNALFRLDAANMKAIRARRALRAAQAGVWDARRKHAAVCQGVLI